MKTWALMSDRVRLLVSRARVTEPFSFVVGNWTPATLALRIWLRSRCCWGWSWCKAVAISPLVPITSAMEALGKKLQIKQAIHAPEKVVISGGLDFSSADGSARDLIRFDSRFEVWIVEIGNWFNEFRWPNARRIYGEERRLIMIVEMVEWILIERLIKFDSPNGVRGWLEDETRGVASWTFEWRNERGQKGVDLFLLL